MVVRRILKGVYTEHKINFTQCTPHCVHYVFSPHPFSAPHTMWCRLTQSRCDGRSCVDYCVDKHMTILCIQRADGVHYGKLDHARPHAASVSNTPPVPSPPDQEEYSRLRGVHCTCIYACIDCKSVSVCMYMLHMYSSYMYEANQTKTALFAWFAMCTSYLHVKCRSGPGCLW